MNEQKVKELAEQADRFAVQINPEEDAYGRPANPKKYKLDRDMKLVELIVQECASLFEDDLRPMGDFTERACRRAIKEHFGVK